MFRINIGSTLADLRKTSAIVINWTCQ